MKTRISSYSPTQEEFENLFHCSVPKDMQVMSVSLQHIKSIICDRSVSLNLPLLAMKEVITCIKLTQKSIPLFMANT